MKKFIVLTATAFALVVSPVTAQEFGLYSINPSASIVMPDHLDMGFGINVSANVGEVFPGVELYPMISYWSAKWQNFNDFTVSNIAVGADAHYTMDSFPEGMYVGGGLNFNIVSSEYPDYNYITGKSTTSSKSDNKIGLSAFAGYTFSMGSFGLFAEARYNMISDFNNLQLSVGVPFSLKKTGSELK